MDAHLLKDCENGLDGVGHLFKCHSLVQAVNRDVPEQLVVLACGLKLGLGVGIGSELKDGREPFSLVEDVQRHANFFGYQVLLYVV
jgi:hypothetical protein